MKEPPKNPSEANSLSHAGDAALSIILAFVESANICEVKLEGGIWVRVLTAAPGQDLGDPRRHVHLNAALDKDQSGKHYFVYLDEIVCIRDIRTNELVFDRRTIPGLERL